MRAAPLPEVFDEDERPYGKEAGANKFDLLTCPTCGRPPTSLKGTRYENAMPKGAFLFRNELAAREYYISGMCQVCQDSVFGRD